MTRRGWLKYAIGLWLIGALAYGAATMALIRSVELFGGKDIASAVPAADGQQQPAEDAMATAADGAPQDGEAAVSDLAAANAGGRDGDTGVALAEAADGSDAEPADAEAEAEADRQSAGNGERIEIVRSVNMRAGPSSGAPVIKVQRRGTELQVKDRQDGWIQVIDREAGETGWIYQSFARDLPGRSASAAPAMTE